MAIANKFVTILTDKIGKMAIEVSGTQYVTNVYKSVTPTNILSQKVCRLHDCLLILRSIIHKQTTLMVRNIIAVLMFILCSVCHAQETGMSSGGAHITLTDGTEVRAKYISNDGVLQVQVENNADYLEVFICKDGQIEDYDATDTDEDTMYFNLANPITGNYSIYLRSKEDEESININLSDE